MNKGDYIKYLGTNDKWSLVQNDAFQITDMIEYDDMTLIATITNVGNGKKWGINYLDLNKHFITFDIKEERNLKINQIVNDN
jgi:hypothetical protein